MTSKASIQYRSSLQRAQVEAIEKLQDQVSYSCVGGLTCEDTLRLRLCLLSPRPRGAFSRHRCGARPISRSRFCLHSPQLFFYRAPIAVQKLCLSGAEDTESTDAKHKKTMIDCAILRTRLHISMPQFWLTKSDFQQPCLQERGERIALVRKGFACVCIQSRIHLSRLRLHPIPGRVYFLTFLLKTIECSLKRLCRTAHF